MAKFRSELARLMREAARDPQVQAAVRQAGTVAAVAGARFVKARVDAARNGNGAAGHGSAADVLAGLGEDPGLSTLAEVEAKIVIVEVVRVAFVDAKSRAAVTSDRRCLHPYSYAERMTDTATVAEFIAQRMYAYEALGLRAHVVTRDGTPARGTMTLRTLRYD